MKIFFCQTASIILTILILHFVCPIIRTVTDAGPKSPPFPSPPASSHPVGDSKFLHHESHFGIPIQEQEEHDSSAIRRTQKRKRRAFERPPGLPFGPWTPSDTTPFPRTITQRKPRRVRQAPSNNSVPSFQSSDRVKVACPECNALLLPKSLKRHLERHSNWTDGKYNAHLYCRYCFAAYSRLDLLIRHQKADVQCVLRMCLYLLICLCLTLHSAIQDILERPAIQITGEASIIEGASEPSQMIDLTFLFSP